MTDTDGELGDFDPDGDVSETGGAIDNDFDDAERSAREQLLAELKAIDAPLHGEWEPGDVAIDLVTRQALRIVGITADTLVEHYEDEGRQFELATYKQHPWLPVGIDDTVLECVFVGGTDDLHSFSNTYDYPEGRLARVPVELAGDSA